MLLCGRVGAVGDGGAEDPCAARGHPVVRMLHDDDPVPVGCHVAPLPGMYHVVGALAVGRRGGCARRGPAVARALRVARGLADELGEVPAVLLLSELHGDFDAAVRENFPAPVSLTVFIKLGYILRCPRPVNLERPSKRKEGGQALDAGKVAPLVAEYLHGAGEPAAVGVGGGLDGRPELREEYRRYAVVGRALVEHVEEHGALVLKDRTRVDVGPGRHPRDRG